MVARISATDHVDGSPNPSGDGTADEPEGEPRWNVTTLGSDLAKSVANKAKRYWCQMPFRMFGLIGTIRPISPASAHRAARPGATTWHVTPPFPMTRSC